MPTAMPTGAKITAAVCFAIVGWIVANYYVPSMPDAAAAGLIREISAAVGAVVGWRVMGPAVGKGYIEAAGSGVKTVVVMIFFALLLFSIREMLNNSVRMFYDGPMEAVLDVFVTMLKRAQGLLSVGVIGSMLIGGIIGGMVTENASRRWR